MAMLYRLPFPAFPFFPSPGPPSYLSFARTPPTKKLCATFSIPAHFTWDTEQKHSGYGSSPQPQVVSQGRMEATLQPEKEGEVRAMLRTTKETAIMRVTKM